MGAALAKKIDVDAVVEKAFALEPVAYTGRILESGRPRFNNLAHDFGW